MRSRHLENPDKEDAQTLGVFPARFNRAGPAGCVASLIANPFDRGRAINAAASLNMFTGNPQRSRSGDG